MTGEEMASGQVEFENFGLEIGRRWVLEGVRLSVQRGRLMALIGPKGSGKTTLLRSIVGLEGFTGPVQQRRGHLRIDGESLPQDRRGLQQIRRRWAMVPASAAPFALSVGQNIAAACRGADLKRRERAAWIDHCLQRCHLGQRSCKDSALDLNQGERRFLCLARAVAMRPAALLLDEPFEGLDPYETGTMAQLLATLSRDHTILIASQHIERAAAIAESIALFIGGHLIETGATAQLLSSPRDPRTEAYLTGRVLHPHRG